MLKNVKWLMVLPIILLLTSCSSVHRIVSDEARQATSLSKVEKDQVKKSKDEKIRDGEIANLSQQVKILLSLPMTVKTVPMANKLLDASLTLTGVPSDRENVLEEEVQDLLSGQQKYETAMNARIAKMQSDLADDDTQIAKDKIKATKVTTTLYRDALQISGDNDTKSTIFHLMEGTIAFIIFCILLRIFFTMTKTGATIAAKLP